MDVLKTFIYIYKKVVPSFWNVSVTYGGVEA